MNILALLVGKTYYRVTYADRDMTMPGIEPLVYIGDGKHSNGEPFHAFQDAVSYVRYGSRLSPGATDQDDLFVYFIPPGEIGEDIVGLTELAAVVQSSLDRAVSAGWPVLPVLRRGWSAAT